MDEFACSTGSAIRNLRERNYSGWIDTGVGDPLIATLSRRKMFAWYGNPPVVNMVVNTVVNDMVNGVVNNG